MTTPTGSLFFLYLPRNKEGCLVGELMRTTTGLSLFPIRSLCIREREIYHPSNRRGGGEFFFSGRLICRKILSR